MTPKTTHGGVVPKRGADSEWNADDEFQRLSGTLFGASGHTPVSSGADTVVRDPATDLVIGRVVEPELRLVDEMIRDSGAAQREWYQRSALERSELLHEVAARTRELRPRIAELLTRETGKAFKESADELMWTSTAIDYYAELGRHSIGSVLGNSTAGQFHYTLKEPMGTVVIILPANFPILLLMWSAAAALAAGNAVIVKPSETATLTTLAYMDVFDALPPGLVQCVGGGADVARHLVSHPDTHMVAFTGSVPTGRAGAAACGQQFKPCLIEASGSDAFIVMPSAPIDIAARAATFAAFLNNGQVCTSGEKFIVHDAVYDEFVAEFVANTRRLRLGHGLDDIDLGPMETSRERDHTSEIIERAVAQGATITIGGQRPDLGDELANGYFFEPTILEGVTAEMDIYGQEVFGPVAPIYRVSSFDEALRLANGSPFGLGSTLYSRDVAEIDRASREIVSGMVWINAPILDNDAGPFGGRKSSGIGRQLGAEGLDTFRHTKLVMVDPLASAHDFWWFPYQSKESWSQAGPGRASD